ncbi:MAG: L,D-transpeptidase family protein [Eubacteriales bacterium]|nr:L,D-transpeptidase family protein [Eubacteriales bacterium]
MKFRKVLIRTVMAVMLLLAFCGTAYADGTNVIIAYETTGAGPGGGWRAQEDGSWVYQKNGANIANCWELVDGHWYRFNENGIMLTGWQTVDGKQYYLSEADTEAHPLGAMYASEDTPDGHSVDENGVKKGPKNPWTYDVVRPNPYGDRTCVEVVIPEQTIYVYQGTELVMVSPCVTGNVSAGHSTPTGTYSIYSKERNRTLRGTNDNGSRYAAFVNFWMPFNRAIGLHDADSWRNSYGGTIYQTGGSHGCVNMPYDRAERLFSISYVGMPVYVHN